MRAAAQILFEPLGGKFRRDEIERSTAIWFRFSGSRERMASNTTQSLEVRLASIDRFLAAGGPGRVGRLRRSGSLQIRRDIRDRLPIGRRIGGKQARHRGLGRQGTGVGNPGREPVGPQSRRQIVERRRILR